MQRVNSGAVGAERRDHEHWLVTTLAVFCSFSVRAVSKTRLPGDNSTYIINSAPLAAVLAFSLINGGIDPPECRLLSHFPLQVQRLVIFILLFLGLRCHYAQKTMFSGSYVHTSHYYILYSADRNCKESVTKEQESFFREIELF